MVMYVVKEKKSFRTNLKIFGVEHLRTSRTD
jgi:hypothetical protein